MDKNNIPKHVAFIMDGNRRWAKNRRSPVIIGHKEGEKCIEPLLDKGIEFGIKYMTFWAFSTENWARESWEVSYLMKLLRFVLDKRIDRFHKKNFRLNVFGNLNMLPKDIQKKVIKWMEITKDNDTLVMNMALSYGGRDEILRAVNKYSEEKIKDKTLSELTPDNFNKYLDSHDQPDPDLLIRTGGEKRLSGFMLWQVEYAELYFTDLLWPDFSPKEFEKAIKYYQKVQRRFGK